jgi:hypothetical protein
MIVVASAGCRADPGARCVSDFRPSRTLRRPSAAAFYPNLRRSGKVFLARDMLGSVIQIAIK